MKWVSAAIVAALGVLCQPAAAQDRATVLVLDMSNSMWGRIEGRAKSEIAREAVASLVSTLPRATRLGLVAYGHRRAGDCRDIETVMPIAVLDASKVSAALGRLTPRGKTPITAALRVAAALLPQGGTVVVVTDGIETCNADPCAAAEELKRKNAGLVAHVVGFDLPSASERARVSCIAERTGGTFVAAMNAHELGSALSATAQAKPKPAVITRAIGLEATDGGAPNAQAVFTIARTADGAVIAEGVRGPIALPPGRYRVSAAAGIKVGQGEADVTASAPAKITIALTGALPAATLKPLQASIPATGTVEVQWTGPNGKGDYISLARPSGDLLETRHYSYTQAGNPAKVRVPGEPGEYELRYFSESTGTILARAKITASPVVATVELPATGVAGTEVPVAFTGPKADEDWVGLARPGADPSSYEGGLWLYATQGSPAKLRLPAEPGPYEVRYVSGLDPKVLASRTITVTPAKASLTAPARGMAGTMITVGFTGMGEGDSFVGVVKKGEGPSAYIGGSYEKPAGHEVRLRLPGEPGAYEVRFVLESNGDYKVLASAPITIDPAQASVDAPAKVRRGEPFSVRYTGPMGEGDYVTVVPAGAAPEIYLSYMDAKEGASSATLEAPDAAGAYEVRYVMAAPGEAAVMVIAKKPITVE